MKKILFTFLCLILPTLTFAKFFSVYIRNYSPYTMVIEREDGVRVKIPSESEVGNVSVKENTTVKNFVNGENVCNWSHMYEEHGLKLVGLTYKNQYGDRYDCLTDYLRQGSNQ